MSKVLEFGTMIDTARSIPLVAGVKPPFAKAMHAFLAIAAAIMMTLTMGTITPVEAASTMRLKAASANGRNLTVGLNKSIVIETPRDVRDVLVSNPTIADAVVRSTRRVYVIGNKVGQANIVLFDGKGRQIASFDIDVARDNSALTALLRRTIPRSDIKVEGVGEGVVLSGHVRNPSDAEKAKDLAVSYVGDAKLVSNYIAVEAREQVQLRVVVAEVERSVTKQLGISLTGQGSRGGALLAGIVDTPFSASQLQLSNTELGLRLGGGGNVIQANLRAMERNGLVRTLAEPNLTAISGERADFLAGGEFPIPVGLDENKISIEFKQFGVSLGFRPIVLSENRISLQIKTEVSEIDTETSIQLGSQTNGFALTIPGLKVRRSETTLELPSGGTMAMAGLLNDEVRKNIDGFPVLKDVPVLGALFRSSDYKRAQTELVVFVTPYIVAPVSRSKTALPTQNLEPASDMNSIFMGKLIRRYDVSGGARRGVKYHGRFGYSYE
ncbi:pilus assembly protein CpaC [Cohaesibacter sp. ES.047]|uniref:type II and III secretion system protein family protein n=1 Tax=Cohaesibacter sp. ES.047 TaxID=1798205 RepID=UPI000BB6A54E|nr:type II and III secretion system protein family protein [Cohaesibacter sp. ES.047]SNY91823.1 pilus assembly protein CpaC [Cohaesibacter sp. ES.047]